MNTYVLSTVAKLSADEVKLLGLKCGSANFRIYIISHVAFKLNWEMDENRKKGCEKNNK